ncbi:MAG TPA: hypothetical protein VGF93_17050 [Solirubrobacteraceae bacterium]
MHLDEIELKILAALEDRRWHNAVDLAQDVAHHQQIVRSRLKALARYSMVERGGWGEGWGANWGRYRITKHGRHELAQQNQLRLVL